MLKEKKELIRESRPPSEQSLKLVDEFNTKLPNLFAELIEAAKDKFLF